MKSLYRLYIILIFAPLFAVLTIITALTAALGCILGADKIFSYWPGRIWSIITLALLLCPVRIKGKEHIPSEPCVVTPNHGSALDIFLLYGYMGVRFKWVMKGSLRKIPFVGWACEKCGFIFVSHTAEGAKQVIRDTEAALADGYHIFIFPEGSRTLTGQLMPLRKGAFRIALDTSAAILPVQISGAYEAYPKTALFPRRQHLSLNILPPIPTTPDTTIPELLTACQEALLSRANQ